MAEEKSTRILHLSDLHIGAHNTDIWNRLIDRLGAATKEAGKFDAIVITGDITDWPYFRSIEWWENRFRPDIGKWENEFKQRLEKFGDKLIISWGNHDYALWGVIRFRWNTLKPQPKRYTKVGNCAFFIFDSSASVWRWDKLARGKVGSEIDEVEKELSNAKKDGCVYKIAVLHHHPLPIVHPDKFERYALLEDSPLLLHFLMKNDFNVILHGHKHRSCVSTLTSEYLHGISKPKPSIWVIACGSTCKAGLELNEFNIITLDKNGLMTLDQYRWDAKERGFSNRIGGIPQRYFFPSLDEFILKEFEKRKEEQGFFASYLESTYLIDQDGDLYREGRCRDLKVEKSQYHIPPLSFEPPPKGYIPKEGVMFDSNRLKEDISYEPLEEAEGVTSNSNQLQGGISYEPLPGFISGKLVIDPDKGKYFTYNPNGTASFTVSCWAFNNFAKDKEDYMRMYGETGIQEEYIDYTVLYPIEKVCLKVEFVDLKENMPCEKRNGFIGKPILGVRLQDETSEKLGKLPENVQHDDLSKYRMDPLVSIPWLTEYYKKYLRFDELGKWICLCMEKPLVGYTYRISWTLPGPELKRGVPPEQKFSSESFIDRLRAVEDRYLGNILEAILDEISKTFSCDKSKIKTSLMVPVFDTENRPKELMIIASKNVPDATPPKPFPIGVGLAGKSFKRKTIETYCEGKPVAPLKKPSPYLIRTLDPNYKVLYAVPYCHPDNENIVLAILNIGTYDNAVAAALTPNEEKAKDIAIMVNKVGNDLWKVLSKGA